MASRLADSIIPIRPLGLAPFEEWEYEDVRRAMKDHLPDEFKRKKAYAEHDHFQDGGEWVGPGNAKGNDTIKAQFAPEDVIGEVLSNVENAFAEPQLGGAPLEEPGEGQEVPTAVRDRINEAISLLSDWWDKQRIQEHIQERQRTGAWAGYAGLRLWIPWRFMEARGDAVTIRSTDDFARALSYIHVTAPSPEVGAILVDKSTQDKCAVYMDEEVTYVNGDRKIYHRAELIYLDPLRDTDEEADTIIKIVYENKEKPTVTARLSLGGRLLFAELRARSLITEPVMRTQRQLNLLTTLVTRIAETAAFRERYTINAKPQGLRVPYTEGEDLTAGAFLERDDEGRLWEVIPQPRTLGANTTTELVGLPEFDKQTGDQKGHVTPHVEIVDPVDPGPYVIAADKVRGRILRMCSQGHLGGTSNAEASGIAYEQARAVFEKDLNKRRTSEEGMLRDLLMAVLTLAEEITGKEGYFTDAMRLTIDQHVNAGPRSPDLVRLDLEAHEAGGMSRQTLMAKLGIEDIDAEMARMEKEATHILTLLEKAMNTAEVFDVKAVLKELGIPQSIIDAVAETTEVTSDE